MLTVRLQEERALFLQSFMQGPALASYLHQSLSQMKEKKNEVFADFSHLRNKELECFILVVWLMAKYAVLTFLFQKGWCQSAE